VAYLLILPFSLFRWGSGREAALGLAVILLTSVATSLSHWTGIANAVAGAGVVFASVALGVAFRYRAGARLRELDRATLLERARLARDLHDTVAHRVSAIAVRAQAGLATAPGRPDAATEALQVIEAEASRALAEMRDIVRVLRRAEAADLAPVAGVEEVRELVGRDGPEVDVEISGDVASLSPAVDAAIYRLAQESVTNARRHARRATRIEVRVAADDACVRLRVSDDGEAAVAREAGAGFGLVGMAERARLLGGTCDAGPGPDGGWAVTAVLPRIRSAT
jgi:signal transduction histidine kinase